ncbi:MAG TPA: ABC transporter ATP-binding protein [Baekduia sp.]|nr:ABC transporter ATP-binding protein [Baekduia sp.]
MRVLPVASAAEVTAELRVLVQPYRWRALATLTTLVAATAVGLLGPLLVGEVVDRVVTGRDAGTITELGVALAGVGVAQALLTGAGLILVAHLGQPMVAQLRERVVDRALRIEIGAVERGGRGDLAARVGDDVSELARAMVEALPAIAGAGLTIALTFVGMAAVDLRLALAGLIVVPIQVATLAWYVPRATRAYTAERAVSGERAQAIIDVVSGAPTVRALGLGRAETARVAARSQVSVGAVVATIRLATRFYGRLNVAEFVGVVTVLVTAFVLVRSGSLSIGGATAGALLFVRLFGQFNIVLGLADEAQRALAALSRLVGVARLQPEPDPAAPAIPLDASMSISAVGHAYEPGFPVLEEIDLELAPGERVALVGVSGAGKTTLAKVAAGFHRPTAGSVSIGGAELTTLGPTALRRAVALVTQEIHVFAGTLAADLRLAAPDALDAELVAALEQVGAWEWVQRLPSGLATVVGSGGLPLTPAQAQQIALARLALADPLVAILDEATAEAGSAGARVLERAADRVLAGRTALIVAHRLSQAAGADRIVVLDRGRVVEEGPHLTLVATGGPYSALWDAWSAERQSSSSSHSPERSQ